jgi:XTP/dITP diphosphohydrolase
MDTEKTEILLGTRNHGKIAEYRSLFRGMPTKLLSFYDFPEMPTVVENGKTFQENALKKAKTIAKKSGRLAVSDDSGLEVDFLNGKPGVLSARFSGDKATDRENTRRVLKLLESAPWEERDARFVCVICIADPKGKTSSASGVCSGKISFEMRGTHGFGYDPIFVPDGYTRTMAELGLGIKNKISHRALAMERFQDLLKEFIRPNNR